MISIYLSYVSNPFAGRHACDGLKVAEERCFGAEARFVGYLGGLLVGLLTQQFLRMMHTVGIDKLRERLASHIIYTLTDV